MQLNDGKRLMHTAAAAGTAQAVHGVLMLIALAAKRPEAVVQTVQLASTALEGINTLIQCESQ